MGRLFLEHSNRKILFNCSHCDTNFTNSQELQSTHFRSSSGQAFLFKFVVNIKMSSQVRDSAMITGKYKIRDVSCKKCDKNVGWFYEYAVNPEQRYKEGFVVLELEHIRQVDGLSEE